MPEQELAIATTLDELLQSALVRQCPAAHRALQTERKNNMHKSDWTVLYQVTWFAAGQIMAQLAERDEHVRKQDAELPKPRAIAHESEAVRDKIDLQIEEASLAFSDVGFGLLSPQFVIPNLRNNIETLVKRVWRTEIELLEKRRQFNLDVFLKTKAEGRDPGPARFARHARMLQKEFGNPSQHDWDNMNPTTQDSRFFFEGIRRLKEMADALGCS